MDINPGNYPNANGSPVWPATSFTGPILAGNVQQSDGSGTLAGLGETSGTANLGYAQMVQSVVVTSTSGTVTTNIIIPAQSQITDIYMMVTTLSAGATFSIGTTASGTTALTGATAGSWNAIGQLNSTLLPTTAGQIARWDNTGNTDIQLTITSTAAGAVGTLTVFYVQGINNAS